MLKQISGCLMENRLISDIGGLPGGPINREEHEPTMTERRIDAMMILLRAKPRSFWASDENRRTIESLEPATYAESAYYEKWVLAMKSLLLEKGILTETELNTKLSEVRSRTSVTER
jgi:nitrile hydratase